MTLTRYVGLFASQNPWPDEVDPVDPPPPVDVGNVRYVRPIPAGQQDGSSWANAASISSLNALLSGLEPGGSVLLRADEGAYSVTTAIDIAAAGTLGNQKRIRGVTEALAPLQAVIRGTRTPWIAPTTESGVVDASNYGGNTIFNAVQGIGQLSFEYIRFENCENIIAFTGIIGSGFTFKDCLGYNVRNGIYTHNTSTITNVLAERFHAIGFSKKFMRIHGNCNAWLIKDCEIDSRWQGQDVFAVGIEMYNTVHDIVIEGGFTANCHDSTGGYWNGDGVTSERGVYNITIRNHKSYGHTDGGYDMKAENVVLENCESYDNKRNFRCWGGWNGTPLTLDTCLSHSPHKRGGSGGAHHVHLTGDAVDEYQGAFVLTRDTTMNVGTGDAGLTFIQADDHNACMINVGLTVTLDETGTLFARSQTTSQILFGEATETVVPNVTTDGIFDLEDGIGTSLSIVVDNETVQGPSTHAFVARLVESPHVAVSDNPGAFRLREHTLIIDPIAYAGVPEEDEYVVPIRIWDAHGNYSTWEVTATIIELIVVGSPIVASIGVMTKKAAASSSESITAALPSNLKAGERMLYAVTAPGHISMVVDGWTEVDGVGRIRVFTKVVGVDPLAEVAPIAVCEGVTSGSAMVGQVCRLRGPDTGGTLIDTSATDSFGSANSYTPTAITASEIDTLGLIFTSYNNDKTSIALSTPNGWEMTVNETTTQGSDASFTMIQKELAASGPQTMPIVSWDGGTLTSDVVTVGIKKD